MDGNATGDGERKLQLASTTAGTPNRSQSADLESRGAGFAITVKGLPPPLADAVAVAAATVVERVLGNLLGRTYSPRIKLLDIEQVCEATGQGKSTIYRLIEEGKFPKPQRNLGRNMWRESALIAWADANDPNQNH